MIFGRTILGAASALALSIGGAWAAGGMEHGGSPMSGQQEPSTLSFEQLDVNQDGKLSAAEYNAGLIGEGQGSISGSASNASSADTSASSGADAPMASGFERADEDRDGQLSRSEFETLASSEGEQGDASQRHPSLGS